MKYMTREQLEIYGVAYLLRGFSPYETWAGESLFMDQVAKEVGLPVAKVSTQLFEYIIEELL